MTHQNWKITGLRDGSMRVDAENHIMIFIQYGIANVYKMGDHKQEVDVRKLSFLELGNWIDKVSNELN